MARTSMMRVPIRRWHPRYSGARDTYRSGSQPGHAELCYTTEYRKAMRHISDALHRGATVSMDTETVQKEAPEFRAGRTKIRPIESVAIIRITWKDRTS